MGAAGSAVFEPLPPQALMRSAAAATAMRGRVTRMECLLRAGQARAMVWGGTRLRGGGTEPGPRTGQPVKFGLASTATAAVADKHLHPGVGLGVRRVGSAFPVSPVRPASPASGSSGVSGSSGESQPSGWNTHGGFVDLGAASGSWGRSLTSHSGSSHAFGRNTQGNVRGLDAGVVAAAGPTAGTATASAGDSQGGEEAGDSAAWGAPIAGGPVVPGPPGRLNPGPPTRLRGFARKNFPRARISA